MDGQVQSAVAIDVMLERVTHVSTGPEIDAINAFEALATGRADAPTAVGRPY